LSSRVGKKIKAARHYIVQNVTGKILVPTTVSKLEIRDKRYFEPQDDIENNNVKKNPNFVGCSLSIGFRTLTCAINSDNSKR
jgi:hypothetical protein